MTEVTTIEHGRAVELAAGIVSNFVANNTMSPDELPGLLRSTYATIVAIGAPVAAPAPEPKQPAVSVRASIKPDYIVCLEDGAKLKMLKRYLKTHYALTPEQYRAKWNLPADYPMVAPNYAEQRRALAVKIGLGRKAEAAPEPTPATARASKKR